MVQHDCMQSFYSHQDILKKVEVIRVQVMTIKLSKSRYDARCCIKGSELQLINMQRLT